MKLQNNWIKEFKVSIVERDFEKIAKLNANIPTFENIEQMKMVQALIIEAVDILKQEKNGLSKKMSDLKKSRKFFDNTKRTNFSKSY